MLATILVIGACVYGLGLRADRIHAGRVVTEPEVVKGSSGEGVPAARNESSVKGGSASGSVTTYRNHTARYWALKYKRRTRQYQNARRTLMASSSVTEAINLAGTVYGSTSTLWALARCESTLNPSAKNASGSSGLMQFMPSTFAGTPFGGFSIWSPYANAMAAGWMLQQGRRSEWVC